MSINKAVIAAAGRGTRFLPVVKAYPKELVPVLSKPNIQYLVEEAIGAGITNIAIVIHFGEKKIQNYFSPDANLEEYLIKNNKTEYLDSLKNIWQKTKLTFIEQPLGLPYGTGSPVLAAKEFIGNDDFAYFYGDDFILEANPGQLLSKMISKYDQYQASAILAVQKVPMEEIYRFGSIKYMDDPNYTDRMSEIMEKLPADQAPSNSVNIGRFIASNKILENIDINKLSRDNELWFTDALTKLAQSGVVLTQATQDEKWLTTGDPLRWLKANISTALQDPNLKNDLISFLKTL
ncbi:MAG: sugar phosphate nucleotidyltransferase [Candidatus Shapirobacteria bacterium]|nr:sugar phosphate nucleotidyltransferase [Candidatus Shapirobacteria bacterium]